MAKIHAAAFTKQRPWSEMEFATLIQSKLVFIIANSHCFALGRTVADEVELLTLATDPEQRRLGHAQDCLDRFHQEARARQASRPPVAFIKTTTIMLWPNAPTITADRMGNV